MADKRKAPNAPDAARKRKAPTIDLTATDVTPPQATAEPEPTPEPVSAAPAESPPEMPPPPEEPPQAAAEPHAAAPTPPDTAHIPFAAMLAAGVAGGVIVAAVIGGLWHAGLLPPNETKAEPDTQARQQIAELQQQIEALQKRPVPTPAVDTKTVDALTHRIAQLETTLKNLPKGADPQLAQKLTDVTTAIAPLAQRLTSAESAIKSGDTAVAALDKRIDDIAVNARQARTAADAADKSVTQLQSKLQDLARNQASTVTRADIDTLQQKLTSLEQAEASARASVAQSAAATEATRLALAAQALRNAVTSGAPYQAELAQARALGADANKLAPLASFAANGIPSAASLAQQLHALLPEMQKIAAPRTQVSGSFLERLQANAGNLVRISPIKAAAGDAPGDVLARLEVEIAHTDIAAAITDVGKLPQAAQAPAQDWLARVKARQAALAAANDFAVVTARALAQGAQ
jgi:hypothetical protein